MDEKGKLQLNILHWSPKGKGRRGKVRGRRQRKKRNRLTYGV